jgi:hypothetical protein
MANTTHGESHTTLFKVWSGLFQRCNNPSHRSYANYGGRGIAVCDRWQLYENFRDDMAVGHAQGLQLDRINNDLGYSPENCRWATPRENNRNKSTNVRVLYEGRLVTLIELSESLGIAPATIKARHRRGLTVATGLAATESLRFVKPARCKLNVDQAAAIKASRQSSKALAAEYGISSRMVNMIKRGAAWTKFFPDSPAAGEFPANATHPAIAASATGVGEV